MSAAPIDPVLEALGRRFSEEGPQSLVAFTEIVERVRGSCLRVALLLLDAGDAEDAFQEACLRAWNCRSTYDPRRDVGKWLREIVRNQALNLRNWRQSRGEHAAVAQRADETTPEDVAMGKQALERYELAVARLPLSLSAVFKLRMEGLSENEVSHLMGIRVGTVKSSWFRAKAQLAALLTEPLERAK